VSDETVLVYARVRLFFDRVRLSCVLRGEGARMHPPCAARREELPQVVDCGDEEPLSLYLRKATETEAAEPHRLFDLTEDRLDDALALGVELPSLLRQDLPTHSLDL